MPLHTIFKPNTLRGTFYIALLILAAFSFLRCHDNDNSKFFDGVEKEMTNNPDSVLTLLQQADTTLINSAADKARYHLLMAEARYKSGIDDTVTDYVAPAIAYYKNHEPRQDAARAYYYWALVMANKENYTSAIINLLRGEKAAAEEYDSLRLALTYRSMADVFEKVFDSKSAYTYHSKAYRIFKAIDATNYITPAELDVARSLYGISKFDECIDTANIILKKGIEESDSNLMANSLRLIGRTQLQKYNYEETAAAYRHLISLGDQYTHPEDYCQLGMAAYELGDIKTTRDCERILAAKCLSDKTLTYYLAQHDGNYKLATYAVLSNMAEQNKAIEQKRQNDFSSILIAYHNSEMEVEHQKRRFDILIFVVILTIIAAISIIIIWIFIRNFRKSRRERSEKNAIIEKMAEEIDLSKESEKRIKDDFNQELGLLIKQMSEKDKAITTTREEILSLLINQFAIREKLTLCYHSNKGKPNEQAKMYREVEKHIFDISNSSNFLNTIETALDRNMKNIMSDFKTDFPKLNPWEYTLLMLYAFNFEPVTVALFQGIDVKTIYKRKANLKRKIAESDARRKEEYLLMLK